MPSSGASRYARPLPRGCATGPSRHGPGGGQGEPQASQRHGAKAWGHSRAHQEGFSGTTVWQTSPAWLGSGTMADPAPFLSPKPQLWAFGPWSPGRGVSSLPQERAPVSLAAKRSGGPRGTWGLAAFPEVLRHRHEAWGKQGSAAARWRTASCPVPWLGLPGAGCCRSQLSRRPSRQSSLLPAGAGAGAGGAGLGPPRPPHAVPAPDPGQPRGEDLPYPCTLPMGSTPLGHPPPTAPQPQTNACLSSSVSLAQMLLKEAQTLRDRPPLSEEGDATAEKLLHVYRQLRNPSLVLL